MIEGIDNLYFTGKNRFLAEVAQDESISPDQQAIRTFIRDVVTLPVRGILLSQTLNPVTPSRIESVVFADLIIGEERSAHIVEAVTKADALLDQRLTRPLTSGTWFLNTLGRSASNLRFNLWTRAQESNSRIIVGAVFT